MIPRPLIDFLLGGLCIAAVAAWAQLGNALDNPEWKEEQPLPPPSFAKDRTIPLEMPRYVTLKVGVDPDTITVGNDGVVRYVIVMLNSTGSVSAFYEGLRCASDEVKVYARASSSGTWNLVSEPQWKGVNDNMPSKHALAFARQGACDVRMASDKASILKRLAQGSRTRPEKFSGSP